MTCPKCSAPLDSVGLAPGVEAKCCPSCGGAFYDAAEVRVNLAPESSQDAGCACPKCGAAMATALFFGGKLSLERCTGCKGYWFDRGEISKLRTLSGTEQVIGLPREHAEALGERAPERKPAARRAYTDDDGDAPPKLKDQSQLSDSDWGLSLTASYRGQDYKHFQTCYPTVVYVLGEFNWKVSVGEAARTRDFIRPPFLLSNDVAEKDSQWSLGEYVAPEEVWSAFGLEGSPPEPRGLAPAQPNPYAEAWDAIFPWAGMFSILAIALALAHAAFGLNRGVFAATLAYSSADAEKSRVTDIFEVPGRRSNLKISIDTNLDNHWAYFNLALIEADTDEALDFGREVSYYHGYDSDGSWSEGSRRNSAILPRVPPGRYYLRIEPESDAPQFGYAIRARRDVPRPLQLFIALALLLAPLGWAGARYYFFENQRWMESDHPWTTTKEDDD